MNIWKILGIDPTKNKKEIKRAFAEKTKEMHPEDNPEGFKMLYTAYRSALKYADDKVKKTDNNSLMVFLTSLEEITPEKSVVKETIAKETPKSNPVIEIESKTEVPVISKEDVLEKVREYKRQMSIIVDEGEKLFKNISVDDSEIITDLEVNMHILQTDIISQRYRTKVGNKVVRDAMFVDLLITNDKFCKEVYEMIMDGYFTILQIKEIAKIVEQIDIESASVEEIKGLCSQPVYNILDSSVVTIVLLFFDTIVKTLISTMIMGYLVDNSTEQVYVILVCILLNVILLFLENGNLVDKLFGKVIPANKCSRKMASVIASIYSVFLACYFIYNDIAYVIVASVIIVVTILEVNNLKYIARIKSPIISSKFGNFEKWKISTLVEEVYKGKPYYTVVKGFNAQEIKKMKNSRERFEIHKMIMNSPIFDLEILFDNGWMGMRKSKDAVDMDRMLVSYLDYKNSKTRFFEEHPIIGQFGYSSAALLSIISIYTAFGSQIQRLFYDPTAIDLSDKFLKNLPGIAVFVPLIFICFKMIKRKHYKEYRKYFKVDTRSMIDWFAYIVVMLLDMHNATIVAIVWITYTILRRLIYPLGYRLIINKRNMVK